MAAIEKQLNLTKDGIYTITIIKDRDLDMNIQAYGVSGDTEQNFEFSPYSGATLHVKNKYNSNAIILELSTEDGSIVLGTDGWFNLNKTSDEISKIIASTFIYDMYLSSSSTKRREFLSGDFIIRNRVTQ